MGDLALFQTKEETMKTKSAHHRRIVFGNDWKLIYCTNEEYKKCGIEINNAEALMKLGFNTIDNPTVPGSFQADYFRKVIKSDPYYADNVLELQKLENIHVWYYKKFEIPENAENPYLLFEGIDTVAEIYYNGTLVKKVDNMFVEHTVNLDNEAKANEILIHIIPAAIAARNYVQPPSCFALEYNEASLYIRKPAHSFGWDIYPRAITSGIVRNVYLCEKKEDSINNVFVYTSDINYADNSAAGWIFFNLNVSGDFITDYNVTIEGKCGESHFFTQKRIWHTTSRVGFSVKDCKLWWPKHYGKPNLYDVKISLYKNNELCDTKELKYGIRMVELHRTDAVDDNGNGDFSFYINNRRIFVMGTNWVPIDAMYIRNTERYNKALDLLEDSDCNMVRCWGGGEYETEKFFDFCDEHGIMVWQDFAMACAVYPNEDTFIDKLKTEVVQTVERLRNHPSLVIWCGDNECDYGYIWKHWGGYNENPNNNVITRRVLPELLRLHDFTRPYLPSSPYFAEYNYMNNISTPERHVWGSREYFKNDEYKKNTACFISETGYHGCPSVDSMKKFISPRQLWPYRDAYGNINDEWLIHCTSMERDPKALHAFRIHLLFKGVQVLFGSIPDDIQTFSKQSQISQAEALKYYVERIRIRKWKKTGIILWNLLDGWPQFSDAMVDYYFVKKLSYYYVKRSQNLLCLMFDEPIGNKLSLYGVNDFFDDKSVSYKVTNLYTGEVVLKGETVIKGDSSTEIDNIIIEENEKNFYYIEWKCDDKVSSNHYFTNIIDIDYEKYMKALERCEYDQFEGM